MLPLDLLAPGSPAGGVIRREAPRWRPMVVSMYLGVGPIVCASSFTYMSSEPGQAAAQLFFALAAAVLLLLTARLVNASAGIVSEIASLTASSPGPGPGATFRIELPASPRAAGTTAEEQSAA